MSNPTNKNSRLLAAADIHGYKEELSLLLKEADYDPLQDRLILLGDYIDADKPSTWDTLDLIYQLVAGGAQALLGNQELRLLTSTKQRESLNPDTVEWLEQLPLYVIDGRYLFVHAGIRPGIPLSLQSPIDLTEIRDEFIPKPLSVQDEAQQYIIIFGHTPTFKLHAPAGEPWLGSRRIAIDTGAKHGYRLSLIDVSNHISYSCSTAPHERCGDLQITTIPKPY
ncbi:hypothetical protein BK133_18905 [Paenibacillus sp. FSL H8-0548]|uniref:metallophosphoesterase family protein n=1 Tax=Paenibacillus sp. FSL H8-0548 TaxID=1920422 RepID=UPI00096C3139|nr:metallophosphoesterase family protein [Paenibacillus sp. FSL H8-0548]OMF28086.1 hypothetical protein BK133_18905 [Paenibacillus sp. FSL H8-0548]